MEEKSTTNRGNQRKTTYKKSYNKNSSQRKTTNNKRKSTYHRKKPVIYHKRRGGSIVDGVILALAMVGVIAILVLIVKGIKTVVAANSNLVVEEQPPMQVELLTPNEYSRPQIAMGEVKGIVIHYTANPGTTAQQNRDYFEGLKDSHLTKASSHFVVGIDGEIIQCIPTAEISYASNERNSDTISIECCHMDESGEFSKETYDSLVYLTAWLCGKFNLTTDDVIRHYDVTGKMCPKYYVEHEDAWKQFKEDVNDYIKKNGVKQK